MVREEILLIAFFYSRSFWAPKHFKQLVKNIRTYYILNQRKLGIHAYYDIRNLIEIRGRGVKTIALPLDH